MDKIYRVEALRSVEKIRSEFKEYVSSLGESEDKNEIVEKSLESIDNIEEEIKRLRVYITVNSGHLK